jgi:hypothetical protein
MQSNCDSKEIIIIIIFKPNRILQKKKKKIFKRVITSLLMSFGFIMSNVILQTYLLYTFYTD